MSTKDERDTLKKDLTKMRYITQEVCDRKYATFSYDVNIAFNTSLTAANTFQDLDLSGVVGSNRAVCYFQVSTGAGPVDFAMKPKSYGGAAAAHFGQEGAGTTSFSGASEYSYLVCSTDASGILQIAASDNTTSFAVILIHHIK